ncbi:hypothetical protein V8B97DRAFT_224908 [Scleroderma yunnanense]
MRKRVCIDWWKFMDLVCTLQAPCKHMPKISSPCLAQGVTKEIKVPQANGKKRIVLIVGRISAASRRVSVSWNSDACVLVACLLAEPSRCSVCEQKPCSFDPFSARYIPDIVLLLRLCYSLMGPSAGSHPALTISMYCLSRSRSARGLQRYLDRTELGCCLSATISLSSTSI